MSTLDIDKAVIAVWNSQSLDSEFTTYWDSGESSQSMPLHDTRATPGQPMPYCVFDIGASSTIGRSSSGATTINEIRQVPLRFSIHMRRKSGVSKSAKQVAGELADEVKKVFGGHPTVRPQALSLDNGKQLVTTYQFDHGMKSGEDEFIWLLSYLIKVDVPVQALTA